jgi:16S rRNA (guanine527-N7)-methyltransferase
MLENAESSPPGVEIIFEAFRQLSPKQKAQFEKLGALYLEWNAKINVISRQDIRHFYVRHVLHSLAIAKIQPFMAEADILDIGTGGGFPGIPLAILFPETRFHLCDSIGKKLKVIDAVALDLGLTNVTTYHKRAEQMDILFDFVLTRAVAPLAELISWTRKNVSKTQFHTLSNGLLALKGGDLTEEIKQAGAKNVQILNLTDYYSDPFFETKKVVYVPYI